jgi:hypothetical protein
MQTTSACYFRVMVNFGDKHRAGGRVEVNEISCLHLISTQGRASSLSANSTTEEGSAAALAAETMRQGGTQSVLSIRKLQPDCRQISHADL